MKKPQEDDYFTLWLDELAIRGATRKMKSLRWYTSNDTQVNFQFQLFEAVR